MKYPCSKLLLIRDNSLDDSTRRSNPQLFGWTSCCPSWTTESCEDPNLSCRLTKSNRWQYSFCNVVFERRATFGLVEIPRLATVLRLSKSVLEMNRKQPAMSILERAHWKEDEFGSRWKFSWTTWRSTPQLFGWSSCCPSCTESRDDPNLSWRWTENSHWRCSFWNVYPLKGGRAWFWLKFLLAYLTIYSTIIWMNIVLSVMYRVLRRSKSVLEMKRGQPVAIFISERGFWNEDEFGSGRNFSWTWLPCPDWSRSSIVTRWVNGQVRMASKRPFIRTKNKEICESFPIPSPFKYRRAHIL